MNKELMSLLVSSLSDVAAMECRIAALKFQIEKAIGMLYNEPTYTFEMRYVDDKPTNEGENEPTTTNGGE